MSRASLAGFGAIAAAIVGLALYRSSKKVRPVLVGVSGGSGSGKTTVGEYLKILLAEHKISSVVLCQDNYYNDLAHLPIEQRARSNFDSPDSIDFTLFSEQLAALQRGETISRPSYDFSKHVRCPPEHNERLAPAPVIIVDGILALHDPRLRALYDVMVFVRTSEAKRLQRRADRDIRERGRTFDCVERQFRETVAPMHTLYVEPSSAYAHTILEWEFDLPLHPKPIDSLADTRGIDLVREKVLPLVVAGLKQKGAL